MKWLRGLPHWEPAALSQQTHAIPAPLQPLYAITLAALEDEHVAAEGGLFERRLNGGRQTVKPSLRQRLNWL